MDCIFCKIVSGEIPCRKIYEDEFIIAFMDINPVSDGHCLVVSKAHISFIHQSDTDTMANLASKLPVITKAVSDAVQADGYNVMCNNGGASGQEVPHMHFHIIPRHYDDRVFTQWPAFKYEAGRADEIFEKILEKLG